VRLLIYIGKYDLNYMLQKIKSMKPITFEYRHHICTQVFTKKEVFEKGGDYRERYKGWPRKIIDFILTDDYFFKTLILIDNIDDWMERNFSKYYVDIFYIEGVFTIGISKELITNHYY